MGLIVIDLDTVMPGYTIFDYGDMVRTFCSSAKEDEQDLSKVGFRSSHFEVLTQAYLNVLGEHLLVIDKDKDNLIIDVINIIYE